MTIEWWPIGRPKPYPKNARKWTAKAVEKVAASIREFGWRQPIVCDTHDVIVIGHLRLAAAQSLALEQVPVHVADLSPAKIRALRLADNRLHEEADWDEGLLREDMLDLKALDLDLSLTGFDARELDRLTLTPDERADECPEVQEVAITRPGDLWLMGEHRLLCGDCTEELSVYRALNERTPDLVLTDPPYGIGAAYASFEDSEENVRGLIGRFMAILQRFPLTLLTSGHRCMWYYPKPTWVLQWVHPAGNGIGPWGFNQSHPILAYGADPFLQNCLGSQPDSLVLACDRQGQTGHPTPKPVPVWRWLLNRGSVRSWQLVFDPFNGSGTTLIVCEEQHRIFAGIELEPRYCDVAVRRWQNFTGREATLDGIGVTFAHVAEGRAMEAEDAIKEEVMEMLDLGKA